ncbi:MAG: hypothetical protein Q9219_004762 [cf. Caloplaca sp. 3 TL-2023]
MWEVDPETKSKLLALQKLPGNTTCCDCSAPSPQWASPKFGTFICLTCAGLHRGLGVHISFVRSISMDAFKGNEILRMEKGGNERWKRFWGERCNNGDGGNEGGSGGGGGKVGWMDLRGELKAFEDVYGGVVGEEYRERLACEVEGREFLGVKKREVKKEEKKEVEGEVGGLGDRGRSRKERNEEFFARKGDENERRRPDLPPSQGGKYAGFGSGPMPSSSVGQGGGGGGGGGGGKGIPGVDEFQRDPVAALTKGFGWFTTTVGKGAKSVNDGWIQPNVQKLAEADLATQARLTAAHVAQNIQSSSKHAAEQFNRFVEDSSSSSGPTTTTTTTTTSSSSSTSKPRNTTTTTVEPVPKDFWDSFGAAGGKVEEEDGAAAALVGDKGARDAATAAGRSRSERNHSPVTQAQVQVQVQQGRSVRVGSPLPKAAAGRASPAPAGGAIGTAAMRKGVGGREKGMEKEEERWDDF